MPESALSKALLSPTDFNFRGIMFKKITAYQFACWKGDESMKAILKMLVDKLPKAEADKLKTALLKQEEILNKEGIEIQYDGKIFRESQFGTSRIVSDIEKFMKKLEGLTEQDVDKHIYDYRNEVESIVNSHTEMINSPIVIPQLWPSAFDLLEKDEESVLAKGNKQPLLDRLEDFCDTLKALDERQPRAPTPQ